MPRRLQRRENEKSLQSFVVDTIKTSEKCRKNLRPWEKVGVRWPHQTDPNVLGDVEFLQKRSSSVELLNVLNWNGKKKKIVKSFWEIFLGLCGSFGSEKFKLLFGWLKLSTELNQFFIFCRRKKIFLLFRSSQKLKKAFGSRLFIALLVETSIQIPYTFLELE